MDANPDEIIAEMTRRLVKEFQPLKIILFGSRARGTARPDSDADLLVGMNFKGKGERRKIVSEMCTKLAGVGMAKDILVASPEEIENYRDLLGTVIRPACKEGRVLYERAA